MIELLSQVNKTLETSSLNNSNVAYATINNNNIAYAKESLQEIKRYSEMLEEMGVFESIRSITVESEPSIPYYNGPSMRYMTPSGNILIAEGDNVEIRATLNGETIGRIDSITYTIDGDR